MARPASQITLTPEEEVLLQTISRSRETPHSLVQRSRIVLLASQGGTNKAIGQELGLNEETVGLWRSRWAEGSACLAKRATNSKRLREAVSELLADKPRPGCPGLFTAEQICQLLALACEPPPDHLGQWTQPELARVLVERGIVESISARSVGRFLKSGGSQTSPDQILAEPRSGERGGLPGGGQDGLHAIPSSPGTPCAGRAFDEHRREDRYPGVGTDSP